MAKLDNITAELPFLPSPAKKRGRPAKPDAMTAAERMAKSRQKAKQRQDFNRAHLNSRLRWVADTIADLHESMEKVELCKGCCPILDDLERVVREVAQ